MSFSLFSRSIIFFVRKFISRYLLCFFILWYKFWDLINCNSFIWYVLWLCSELIVGVKQYIITYNYYSNKIWIDLAKLCQNLCKARTPYKNDTLKSTDPTQPSFQTAFTQPSLQTAFWNCYNTVVILCLNHLFHCSYKVQATPYKMASEMGLEAIHSIGEISTGMVVICCDL